MIEDESYGSDTEYVEAVGVVLTRSAESEQHFDVYRVAIMGADNIVLSPVSGAQARSKKAAVKLAQMVLVDISQGITRGHIEFYSDTDAA